MSATLKAIKIWTIKFSLGNDPCRNRMSTSPAFSGLRQPLLCRRNNVGNGSNQCQGVTGGGIMNGDNEQGGSIFAIGNCYCFPYPYCCGNGAGIPGYQAGVNMTTNGGSTVFRNYPDVAMMADNNEIFFQTRKQILVVQRSGTLLCRLYGTSNQKSGNWAGRPGGLCQSDHLCDRA